MLGENVEDDRRTVNHLHAGGIFEGTSLAWRQIIIDDDGVRLIPCNKVSQFTRLT